MPGRIRHTHLFLIAIIVAAAALRIYGIGWGLPQVYEEGTPLRKAWAMWGWGPQKSFDPNPHFFNYPSLIIYLHLLGQALLYLGMKLSGAIHSNLDFRVLYVVDKTNFFTVGRLITATFGVATVWATALLGRRITSNVAATVAALIVAVHTFHITKSQVVEVDVPLAFFVVLALYFAVRLFEAPTRRNQIASGIVVGLATSTKYTAAFLIVPLILASWLAHRASTGQRKGHRVLPARQGLAVMGITAAVAFLATSPFVLLDFGTFRAHMFLERQHMTMGHFGLDSSVTAVYYARELAGNLLGIPLLCLATAGIIVFAAVRRKPWALIMVSFVVPYLLAIGSWKMKADRYVLPILPVLILFASALVSLLVTSRPLAHLLRAKAPVFETVFLLVCAFPVVTAFPEHLAHLKPDTRTAAKEWIEGNVVPGSFIVTEGYGPELFGALNYWPEQPDVRDKVFKGDAGVPLYAVQFIPLFQVEPERSEAFYDLRLYQMADLIITSSSVASRYRSDPNRFDRQVAFYDTLGATYEKIKEFAPGEMTGPTITVYKNSRQTLCFAARDSVKPPGLLVPRRETPSGEEGFFYYSFALNYETFLHFNEALTSYMTAFRFPFVRPETYRDISLGIARSLIALGDTPKAMEFLQRAASTAPSPRTANELLNLRRMILSGSRGSE